MDNETNTGGSERDFGHFRSSYAPSDATVRLAECDFLLLSNAQLAPFLKLLPSK